MKRYALISIASICLASCTQKCMDCTRVNPYGQPFTYSACEEDIPRNKSFNDAVNEAEALGYTCDVYAEDK